MASNRWDQLGNVDRIGDIVGYGHLFGFPFGNPKGVTANATTGVPVNGKAGYMKGALFFNPISGGVYSNTGTLASSIWTRMDLTAALAAQGVAAGYKITRGVTALDGSNPTPVTTGLSTVVAATVSLEGTAAPGVGTSVLTVASTNYATGALAVYAWKVTGTGDCTLIASTGTENFEWVAVGT